MRKIIFEELKRLRKEINGLSISDKGERIKFIAFEAQICILEKVLRKEGEINGKAKRIDNKHDFTNSKECTSSR